MIILGVIGALVLALAASAQAADAGTTGLGVKVAASTGEGGIVVEVTTPSPEAVLSVPEAVLSGGSPAPAPETVLSGSGPEGVTPPSEAAAPPPPATTPEAAPPPAPSAPSAPESVQPAPAPEAASPTPTPETLVTVSGPERPEPTVLGGGSAGKDQETQLTASDPAAQGSASGATTLGGGPLPPAGGPPAAVAGLPEVATAVSSGPPMVRASVKMTVAQRATQFDCDLSSLGGHSANSCGAGWLDTQRLLSQASVGLSSTAASVAASVGGPPPNGGHGGSGAGSPPVNPAPGPTPAPSGASGSAAGSSGIALSGFLTLAALLLLGAPRAMRRLRLSCQPWLTACFVLIPERPG